MIRKFLSWPIRAHLLLLVILLALPSITLILYWGLDARDEAIEDAKGECLKFVNAVAGEQQAVVAGVQQLLATLALLPDVASRNIPVTDAILSDLLKTNPLFSSIGISDTSGLIWASATPYEGAISVADRKYFRDAVRTGKFSSGEFSVGRLVKKPVLNFAQPVMNASNELTNVIAASINLDHIQSLFEKIKLPVGSSFSLLDHQGIILYRNSRDPFSEQLMGKRDIQEELFTKMVEGPDEGTYEAMGNDRKVRLTAYKKLRLPHESQPYLYIRSSIPKASVVSEADAAILRNMAALMSIFVVGLILAVFIGKRVIVEPITKLKEASRQLTAGLAPVNVSGQVKDGELGELAHAFDDMAKSLLQKEKEQLSAEEELRLAHARAAWLARLPEENPNPVLRVSVDGDIRYCNPMAMELEGWKCEVGLPMPSPILPLVRKAIAEYREVLQDIDLGERTYSVAVTSFPEEGYANVYGRDITERKRAEEELRQRERLLQNVIDGSTSPIFLKNLDGKFITINAALEKMLGISRDELRGKTDYDIAPKEVADHWRAHDKKVMSTGKAIQIEEWADLPDGHHIFLANKFPLVDGDGHTYGVGAISHDITERKRTEEELRESEERFRTLAENNPHIIARYDRQHRILYMNQAAEQVTMGPAQKFLGKSARELGMPPELCTLWEQSQNLAFAGERVTNQFEMTDPAGRKRVLWDLFVPELGTGGSVQTVLAISQDITELVEAQEALRQSRAEAEARAVELQAVLDIAPVAIWIAHDPLCLRITGNRHADEIIMQVPRGANISASAAHGDADVTFKVFRDSIELKPEELPAQVATATGRPVADEVLELRFSDGRVVNLFEGAVPLFDTAGRVRGAIATAMDVTPIRRAEEALREANESLEQKVRERTMDLQKLMEQLERSRHELRKLASELVLTEQRERKRIAEVLHDDIAQILAAIRMRLDLLQAMPSDQKDKQVLMEAKAFLLQSIQETRALMNELGNPLLFDLGLKPACEALADRLMETNQVRIRCDIRETYKNLNPDMKILLYQVVLELLNNVVKHSQAKTAHVLIDMENEHFRVKVTDDGAGFDPQTLGAPTIEGGFGLYSIRERLTAMDGSIEIKTAPGAGTIVTAILPAAWD